MSPYPWRETNLEAAAFDMDGTLLDSAGFGAIAIRAAFGEMIKAGALAGIAQPPTASQIRAQIGKPPYDFYRDLLPPALRAQAPELHRRATVHEDRLLRDGSGRLFEGAREVLLELKRAGLKLLLVSNCSETYMETVVEVHALEPLLDYRACVGDLPGRTKTGLLAQGLAETGVKACVMVGDREHDLEAASAAGIWFIGCAYGYGEPAELKAAEAIIDDIRELPALLLQ